MFPMRDFLTQMTDTQMTSISEEIFQWTEALLSGVWSLICSISNILSEYFKNNVLQLNYIPLMERHAIMPFFNPN